MVKWKVHEENLTPNYSLSDEILKNEYNNIIFFFGPQLMLLQYLLLSL